MDPAVCPSIVCHQLVAESPADHLFCSNFWFTQNEIPGDTGILEAPPFGSLWAKMSAVPHEGVKTGTTKHPQQMECPLWSVCTPRGMQFAAAPAGCCQHGLEPLAPVGMTHALFGNAVPDWLLVGQSFLGGVQTARLCSSAVYQHDQQVTEERSLGKIVLSKNFVAGNSGNALDWCATTQGPAGQW